MLCCQFSHSYMVCFTYSFYKHMRPYITLLWMYTLVCGTGYDNLKCLLIYVEHVYTFYPFLYWVQVVNGDTATAIANANSILESLTLLICIQIF